VAGVARTAVGRAGIVPVAVRPRLRGGRRAAGADAEAARALEQRFFMVEQFSGTRAAAAGCLHVLRVREVFPANVDDVFAFS
jgi:hypothetical protein